MALSVTAPDPQAGVISLYREAGVVRITKSHVAVLSGATPVVVPGTDATLASVLNALVAATTITNAERTAFTAVMQAVNTYLTTQAGL